MAKKKMKTEERAIWVVYKTAKVPLRGTTHRTTDVPLLILKMLDPANSSSVISNSLLLYLLKIVIAEWLRCLFSSTETLSRAYHMQSGVLSGRRVLTRRHIEFRGDTGNKEISIWRIVHRTDRTAKIPWNE